MSTDPKQLLKEAEACLSPGWFSAADHVAAASLFESAGKQFVLKSKDGKAAMGAYLKAAKSHLSKGGRGYEAAALAYEEAGKAFPEEARQLYTNAIDVLVSNGSLDRAIEVCDRGADVTEKHGDVATSLDFCLQLAKLCKTYTPSNTTKTLDAMQNAFKRLVKARRLPEAVDVGNSLLRLNQEFKFEVGAKKMYLSLMVLELARADVVKARQILNKALAEDVGFAKSMDAGKAQDYMDSFENMDGDAVKLLVSKPPFTSLDYAVTMLAQEVKPSGGKVRTPAEKEATEEEEEFPDLS